VITIRQRHGQTDGQATCSNNVVVLMFIAFIVFYICM